MIDKILFPTDNSDEAEKALKYAVSIAKKFNSEIIIFYSYDLKKDILSKVFGSYQINEEMENEVLFSYQSVLNEIKNELDELGIKSKVLIGKGNPGLAITEAVISENCNMIIMGRRKLNATKSLLLGSVSNYVVHHAKCPVLLVD